VLLPYLNYAILLTTRHTRGWEKGMTIKMPRVCIKFYSNKNCARNSAKSRCKTILIVKILVWKTWAISA
jgi:hypothetical protein